MNKIVDDVILMVFKNSGAGGGAGVGEGGEAPLTGKEQHYIVTFTPNYGFA